MDVYGGLSVDDLLDLPSDDFFSSSSSSSATPTAVSDLLLHHPSSSTTCFEQSSVPGYSNDFTDILCVPTDDAAELEWLSSYMDDSFTDFQRTNSTPPSASTPKTLPDFTAARGSKRSRPSTSATTESPTPNGGKVENFGNGSGRESTEVQIGPPGAGIQARSEPDVRADSALQLSSEGSGTAAAERSCSANNNCSSSSSKRGMDVISGYADIISVYVPSS
ncbi:UNVERIFIED_CONTAM: GATA transcription factor 4 [Sesamum latifolium]|uniref:GATA transcription factor 4 n=1 Tax=Sesamum latifolium TaxID=2727402 RepID=A0AAW2YFW1_9LAMI